MHQSSDASREASRRRRARGRRGEPKKRDMPSTRLRYPDEVATQLEERAEVEGTSIQEVLRRAVVHYLRTPPAQPRLLEPLEEAAGRTQEAIAM